MPRRQKHRQTPRDQHSAAKTSPQTKTATTTSQEAKQQQRPEVRMLCPSVFQPPVSPFMDLHWPVRSLWPDTRPLFYQMEQEMMRHMQEMRHNMEFMDRLHQKIFEEIDQSASLLPLSALQPISFQVGKENNRFALTLDTKEFSPEELSVKQVGRKLRVSGKTEKKQDDGKGSYSYRCQEFRQEFDLPEGVNPETVTCSLANGQLQIQAPQLALTDGKERVVPISVNPALTCPLAPPTPEPQGNIPIPVKNETNNP